MEKFVRLSANACPLLLSNLNTDQILPARYLKWPRSKGLGTALFQDLRFDSDGHEREDFPLNQSRWQSAKILLAGRNFGGGSSREAAVYSLYDYGFRCVIAPSFGDIFAQNAVKNGLLTAVVSETDVTDLAAAVSSDPDRPISVDLPSSTEPAVASRNSVAGAAIRSSPAVYGLPSRPPRSGRRPWWPRARSTVTLRSRR